MKTVGLFTGYGMILIFMLACFIFYIASWGIPGLILFIIALPLAPFVFLAELLFGDFFVFVIWVIWFLLALLILHLSRD